MGRGLPENWEKHKEDPGANIRLHYFNPERLERLVVQERKTGIFHDDKYVIRSSVQGPIDSASNLDDARRKANQYMNKNIAYS